MKIAISANGKDLESTINERFGRCPYFIIVETDDMSYEAIENTNAKLSTSAGIQAASHLASTGVKAVITGNCGPKAMQVFAATEIQIILGQQGLIRDAVEAFKSGALNPVDRENVPETYGSSTQAAAGQGLQRPGMGRGMNGGGGRCMGGGGGRGMGGRGMGGGGGRGMGGGGRGMGGGGQGMGGRGKC